MIGDTNGKTNFPHKIISTNRQVSSLRKAFTSSSSSNIKLSKTKICVIIQSGRFLGKRLGTLVKVGLPLMKNAIKLLAKCFLIPIVLTTEASTTDAGIHKKIIILGRITLIIEDIMKIVKSLEGSGLLKKRLMKQSKTNQQNKKIDFLTCYYVHSVIVY